MTKNAAIPAPAFQTKLLPPDVTTSNSHVSFFLYAFSEGDF